MAAKTKTAAFTALQNVSAETVANIICNAVEGNHMTTSWCAGFHLKSDAPKPQDEDARQPWYCNRNLYNGAFVIEVTEIVDESTGKTKVHTITRESIHRGINIMADKWPAHFADMVSEDGGDAITADVFLQCVVLGDIVYG